MPEICKTLEELSEKTWNDLADSHDMSIGISEESITDFLLLNIARRHKKNIFTYKFSKMEEGRKTGADWEWWFLSPGSAFGMRVQAKKLNLDKQRYDGIKKHAGSSRQLQIN